MTVLVKYASKHSSSIAICFSYYNSETQHLLSKLLNLSRVKCITEVTKV